MDESLHPLSVSFFPVPALIILLRTELDEGACVHDASNVSDLAFELHGICAHRGSAIWGRERYGAALVQRAYFRQQNLTSPREGLCFRLEVRTYPRGPGRPGSERRPK